MLAPVVICDFTGVYDLQPFMRRFPAHRISCADLSGTDCYCDAEAEHALRQRLAPHPVRGVHFLDSGNYHYLTKLWAERIDRPFALALFDHHSDMQPPAFGSLLSCGSWVCSLLDTQPYLRKVCIVGAQAGVQETAAYADRVVGVTTDPDDVAWKRFVGTDSLPVYVSVDKDVLNPTWAATNWDQGAATLPGLTEMLTRLLAARSLLGADICGECSFSEALSNPHCNLLNDRANETLCLLLRRYL